LSTVVTPPAGSVVTQQTTAVVAEREGGGTVVVTPQIGRRAVVVTRGAPGPRGPAGGGNYEHTQSIPATGWTVAHNLGRHPSVSVTDHLGNLVIADTTYVDLNIVQITHGTAMIGYAYCN